MCTLDRTRDPFQVASSPHPVLSSSLPSRQAGFSQCCVCTLFVESFSPCVVFPVCFCRCCFSNLRLNPFVIFLCSPSVCNCQCICLTKNEERGFCEWRFRGTPGDPPGRLCVFGTDWCTNKALWTWSHLSSAFFESPGGGPLCMVVTL